MSANLLSSPFSTLETNQEHDLPDYNDARLRDVFALPVLGKSLIYSPLHDFAALVDAAAVRRISRGLLRGDGVGESRLAEIVSALGSAPAPAPSPRQGNFRPEFLGLIPTRGCNLACGYCGFWTSHEATGVMDLKLACDAVDWYIDLVYQSGVQTAEIHYFGGEPFCADEVLDLTVHHATVRAQEAGCAVRFEVATNGVFSRERCEWAADNLDTIVLSLDGPADIQDRHRPRKDGSGAFETVVRNARILMEGTAELCFRVCVTDQTVDRMQSTAAWLCQDFRPTSVCFEPVQPCTQPDGAEFKPPDPWTFARNFVEAAWILESHGVEPVYSTADIRVQRVSFCPVGADVPIVSPDGVVSACYLLRRDWEAKGLDLRLGRIGGDGSVSLDPDAITAIRNLNVLNKPFCDHCFCKWHCAGGCHVNHALSGLPGTYDRLCIQTRIIALRNILKAMDREDLTREILRTPAALEKAVWQASDVLFDVAKLL